MQFDLDKELLAYFTDVEHLRTAFKNSIATPKLTKRLLIIHGVGGIGKSSLMKMFRMQCKSMNVPIGLTSGDESKSALDVLIRWTADLKVDGIEFPEFSQTFEHYRAIQAKVDKQSKKALKGLERVTAIAGKAASKTAETVASALAGAALGSVIPGIGTAIGGLFGGILGGMGADALADWLHGQGFAKPDIDLLLDPTKRMTDDFLADLDKIAPRRRIVLMLDTYEKMITLEDWACNLAQRLSPNLLLVIAGRGVPNWDRRWVAWLAQADVEEIELMSHAVMTKLVRRYYKTLTDSELDPAQAEGIIQFARGLPIAITSAVDLMVKYHARDFQAITPKVINDLAKRLQEGVPDNLKPALQAAAILRWFDEPILRAVMQKTDVSADYDELQRFPFVVLHDERFALHDVVRETLDANFRARDPELYLEWHERAAVYFEKRMEKATGEEAWRLGLERLNQRICVDEGEGIHLFQMMAEELMQYWFFNRLREILNDVKTYPLIRENSRSWWKYYYAQLLNQVGPPHFEEVEEIYEEIIEKNDDDSFLRAKALLHLMDILTRDEYYMLPGIPARVASMLIECEKLLPEDDWERYLLLIRKSVASPASFQNIYTGLIEVINYCISKKDYYALTSTCQWVKGFSATHGRWREFLEIEQKVAALTAVNANPMLKARTFSEWQVVRIWMGRYAEAEKILRKVIDIQSIGVKQQGAINRDLLYAIAVQRRVGEVIPLLEREHEKFSLLGQKAIYDLAWVLRLLGIAYLCGNDTANAKKCLLGSAKIVDGITNTAKVYEDEYFLGMCCLARHEWQEAKECFSKYLVFPFDDWQLYIKSGALVGLIRANEALGREEEIPSLLFEAEGFAQYYEYNDHLAFLRLMQGHSAWKSETIDDSKDLNGLTPFEIAFHNYQQALIYALRYNRFLLDEVLWGDNVGTPLDPIIPHCLERGQNPLTRAKSRRMLVALREWWMIGVNDIGAPRPDTISTIPEGIPLLEAEKLARECEPGDGSPQIRVVEQIETFLANINPD